MIVHDFGMCGQQEIRFLKIELRVDVQGKIVSQSIFLKVIG